MTNVLLRNNVTIHGTGRTTLLFAHGFGCSQNTWSRVASAFEKDYKVVLFDYVGAGGSDLKAYNSGKYSTLDGYAQDILDICDALQLTKVVLVGHSVSCMIGALASIKRPSLFSKLVFVSPSPYFFNDGDYSGGLNREDLEGLFTMMENNYLGWSSMMAPLIVGNSDRPGLGEELTGSFCSTDPRIAQEFARLTFFTDNRYLLSQMSVPSLSLQCADDMLAPPFVGEYILQNTPGNALKSLRATGHCPQLSAPEEVISVLEHYLTHYEEYHPASFTSARELV